MSDTNRGEAARTGQRGSRVRRLAVLLVTPALLLALLELGSYAVGRFPGPVQPLRVGNIQLYGRHDALLFWSLDPGALAPDGTRWINSAGLRGPELEPKEAGSLRILSLGESTTFAAQMEYERCYSAVLERLLSRARDGAPLRVLNGGVPGYSLFQGVRFLLERSAPLEPDVVLFYFGFNDFLPVAYLDERAGGLEDDELGSTDRELFEARRAPLERCRAFLLQHSNLVRGILGSGRAGGGKTSTEPTGSDGGERGLALGDRPRVPAQDRADLLGEALAYARARSIELVIVVPFYREFEDHAPLLREFAEREGVPIVDLPRLLPTRLEGPRPSYFFDEVHPTPQGHRLIAEAIRDVLAPLLPGS